MKRKDVSQKLSRLLDGVLPDDQADDLRRKVLSGKAGQDDYELYRRVELELERLDDSQSGRADWDTRRDALRSAMERDALLGRDRQPIARRMVRYSAVVALAALVVVSLPIALRWLVARAPLPVDSSITVEWQPTTSPARRDAADPPADRADDRLLRVAYIQPDAPSGRSPTVEWTAVADHVENLPRASAAVIVVLTPPVERPPLAESLY